MLKLESKISIVRLSKVHSLIHKLMFFHVARLERRAVQSVRVGVLELQVLGGLGLPSLAVGRLGSEGRETNVHQLFTYVSNRVSLVVQPFQWKTYPREDLGSDHNAGSKVHPRLFLVHLHSSS